MKTITNVKSQTKPLEIDDYTSSTTVFVRSNIKESTETDPVFGTESTVYTYDEVQYTYPEWNKKITDEIKENGDTLQNKFDVVQSVVAELIKIISPATASDIDEAEDDKSPFIQFYIQMISSKLLTIDQVPEQFKNSVLKLTENKE